MQYSQRIKLSRYGRRIGRNVTSILSGLIVSAFLLDLSSDITSIPFGKATASLQLGGCVFFATFVVFSFAIYGLPVVLQYAQFTKVVDRFRKRKRKFIFPLFRRPLTELR